MLGWLRRRRETAERIEAEAEAVMREYAVRAYPEDRRRRTRARQTLSRRTGTLYDLRRVGGGTTISP
jgi:hypothetical protein